MSLLHEIATCVLQDYADAPGEVTVVFPNRRSGLFFRQQLSRMIDRPRWSPAALSIVDFIRSLSPLQPAERLELVLRLYRIFNQIQGKRESFDRFWYWGETLLRDFDEIDKFLVPADKLFVNLADLKRLEESIDYLTEEQKNLISGFWKSFDGRPSEQQSNFTAVWDLLLPVYEKFRDGLLAEGLAYDGLLYRRVAEDLKGGLTANPYRHIIFAGFNALSTSEEHIITWFVEHAGARVFWEADDYYLNDERQEAGMFLRELRRRNRVLEATFKPSYGSFTEGLAEKRIEVIAAPQRTGQAQLLAGVLQETVRQFPGALGDARSAVVLPDEKLLYPVLNAMPPEVSAMNITMGYPLSSTLAFGWLSALIDFQLHPLHRHGRYHYRPVMALLNHPFIQGLDPEGTGQLLKSITEKNKVYVSGAEIAKAGEGLAGMFRRATGPEELLRYLQHQLDAAAGRVEDPLEQEYLHQFHLLLNQLARRIGDLMAVLEGRAFLRLFRQMIQQFKLPFEGEPLAGLQVMGLLETRNLDFEHVFVLSMNEGVFPASEHKISYLPPAIRKAYGLPTVHHRDAMHAYVFYNLLRPARNIFLFYNAVDDQGQPGELSRFVRQLGAETAAPIRYRSVHWDIRIPPAREIVIEKDSGVMARLMRFVRRSGSPEKYLTPSAINQYLDCSLRFYYQQVLDLREQDEVQEEMDALLLGNIFHSVMEQAYLPVLASGGQLTADRIGEIIAGIDPLIDAAYARHFGQDEGGAYNFSGLQAVSRFVVHKTALQVLEMDRTEAPFEIVGLEAGIRQGYVAELMVPVNGEILPVGLKGVLDRIDRSAGRVRVLDYKTGKDLRKFDSLPSLFDRDDKNRNKAVLQALCYGLLYRSKHPEEAARLELGLFNLKEVFREDFTYLLVDGDKNLLRDARPLLPGFQEKLQEFLAGLFDARAPFSQTDDVEKCRFCSFAALCRRN
jgi:hypothetical protein